MQSSRQQPAPWSPICIGGFTRLNERSQSFGNVPHGYRPRQQGPTAFRTRGRGGIAFANYRQTPQAIIITHTETPRALRGHGIASELVQGALELIRADGHKVIAGCGFVVDYLNKHPEFADLTG
jgi:predicted GNAT family acetyltransferase